MFKRVFTNPLEATVPKLSRQEIWTLNWVITGPRVPFTMGHSTKECI